MTDTTAPEPFARRVTVALPGSLRAFPKGRTAVRGNPVRPRVLEGRAAVGFRLLGLDPAVPLVVVTGGGTGALGLNRIVAEAAPRLVQQCQVLHLTGRDAIVAWVAGRRIPDHPEAGLARPDDVPRPEARTD